MDHDDPSFHEEVMLFIGKNQLENQFMISFVESYFLCFGNTKIAMTRDESAHISWYKWNKQRGVEVATSYFVKLCEMFE